MIHNFVEEVKKGNIDVVEHTKEALQELHDINQTHHFLTHIADEQALEQAVNLKSKIDAGHEVGKLAGVLVTVKDGICVKGMPSESSSKILRGYIPVFDATAIKQLRGEGAIIVGKTIQDEFGFGSFCTNVPDDKMPPKNPNNDQYVCGGSSGGAGGLAKAFDKPHIAVGESTGGSIVAPASFCGVPGLCPTYGRVSRYGLIDYASSLDKIGPICKNISDIALALEVMQGFDVKDSTSSNEESHSYPLEEVKGMRVGFLTYEDAHIDPRIRELMQGARTALEEQGVATMDIKLPLTEQHALSTYYLIAMAEASTNLAKYAGMRYGAHDPLGAGFNEYFSSVRQNYFGDEAKRRLMVGTFTRMAGYRDAYYQKAAKIRSLIIEEYEHAFRNVDALICPTMPITAPKFEDVEKLTLSQHYAMDLLTVGPNLAGLPHLSVPIGLVDAMPVGLMITGKHFGEHDILKLGAALE